MSFLFKDETVHIPFQFLLLGTMAASSWNKRKILLKILLLQNFYISWNPLWRIKNQLFMKF